MELMEWVGEVMGVAGLMGSPLLAAPCKADILGNATLARRKHLIFVSNCFM